MRRRQRRKKHSANAEAHAECRLDSLSPKQEIKNKHDEQYPAEAAADHGAAVVITTAPAKKNQKDQDDQDQVQMRPPNINTRTPIVALHSNMTQRPFDPLLCTLIRYRIRRLHSSRRL